MSRLEPLFRAAWLLCLFAASLAVFHQWLPGIFPWPLELFAHFIPQIGFGLTAVSFLAGIYDQRRIFGLILLISLYQPYNATARMARPAVEWECASDRALRITTINIQRKAQVLDQIAQSDWLSEQDIVAFNEIPPVVSAQDMQSLFLSFPYQYGAIEHGGHRLPFGLFLISRTPLENVRSILPEGTAMRPYLTAEARLGDQKVRIIPAHPVAPGTPQMLQQRNRLFDAVADEARESETFIVLGDFNSTPWVPAFSRLPGTRAGQAQLVQTWQRVPVLIALPIDHILFDGSLKLIDARVQPSVGSDHKPVSALLCAEG